MSMKTSVKSLIDNLGGVLFAPSGFALMKQVLPEFLRGLIFLHWPHPEEFLLK